MPNRALIVVDVQNEYVDGKLRIEYPQVRSSLANIGLAADAAEAARIPVVYVQHTTPEQAPIFARGSHGWQLHESLANRPKALLIEKQQADAFAGTELAQWLRSHEIDTLTIVGYMTHNCDVSTILHASHDGYAIEFLHDAAGSVPYSNRAGTVSAEELHRVFSIVLQTGFAAVLSTQEWLTLLRDGGVPERDSVPASNWRALEQRKHSASA